MLFLLQLTETNEIVNGLSNITSETEQIRSLEVSISTVFMEDLSTNVSGIVNVSFYDNSIVTMTGGITLCSYQGFTSMLLTTYLVLVMNQS